ncbi:MAG: hypothetical protein ACRDOH_04705 [Streptosporangiaceae bacterium]
MSDFGTELVRLMVVRGLGLRELARMALLSAQASALVQTARHLGNSA